MLNASQLPQSSLQYLQELWTLLAESCLDQPSAADESLQGRHLILILDCLNMRGRELGCHCQPV